MLPSVKRRSPTLKIETLCRWRGHAADVRATGFSHHKPMNNTVYNIITERIITLLEQGTVAWHKPWTSQGSLALPKNLHSGRPYRGVNTFLLHATEFGSPYWLTFKQALARGGNVRKGEKSTPVVFWKWLDPEQGAPVQKRIPLLRYYSVFNVEQCEAIDYPKVDTPVHDFSPIQSAAQLVKGMPKPPVIQHGGDSASYAPALDLVRMPVPERFEKPEAYYDTLFHELTHATGHESRLNRRGVADKGEHNQFGSDPYAREELVAEMGAAFLCGHAGIVDRVVDNSAAYIASWLKQLKNDAKLVVTAAAQAQKAADYILGLQPDESAED